MNEDLRQIETGRLKIVHYPDPRLRETCAPVETVGDAVRALIDRMFELMFQFRGVGLAAPQVSVPLRLFVASPTFDPQDRHVFINPEIIDTQGRQDGEEGCLSFPGISCKIKRKRIATVRALGPDGQPFEKTGEDLFARIMQHEVDHLDGRLLVDRMGSVARLANRRALKELEAALAGR